MTGKGKTTYFSLILLLASFGPVNSEPQAYKWSDDAGRVNYTQHKPTKTTADPQLNQQSIEPITPHRNEPDYKSLPTSEYAIQLKKAIQNHNKAKNDANSERVQEKNRGIRNENCKKAKNNLELTRSARKLAYKNKDGELIRADEQSRADMAKRASSNIQRYCKP